MTDTLLTQAETERTADETAIDAAETPAADPSVRVIEAVADATDADAMEMAPLYDVIDPDALDALVGAGIEGHVAFEYGGCDVTVHGDATVVVEEVR